MAGFLAGCLGAGELLYRNMVVGLVFLPIFPFLRKRWEGQRRQEEAGEHAIQFKDALISIKSSLEAGYSMENAILAAGDDLACIYPDECFIRVELERIMRSIANSVPVEEAFHNFAVRSGLEDVQSFAEIYRTARKSGGDLLRVIQSSVAVITDKTELKREIRTILTAKRMECRIMRMIPPGMIAYFRLFSPGYLDILYEGMPGQVLMTVLLFVYLALIWLMEYITGVEI
ncbi:MAG: type II secretion system F family protein [Lachnospiraceae bacterium]|nr:type II secretion system F family protein [Lachnospiraceae bacterium]